MLRLRAKSMSTSPEPGLPPLPSAKCDLCGAAKPEPDLLRFGELSVCGDCKPAYVQRLAQGNVPTRPAFHDLARLTKWLRWLLMSGVGLMSVYAFLEVLTLMDFSAGNLPDPDEISGKDLAFIGIGVLHTLLFLTTGVLFLRWIYFANKNVRYFGARHLRFTPGWSIGWYFVPIWNLWKPYQAMKEIWRASIDPAAWSQVPRPGLLPLWWTFWIISSSLSRASTRLELRADTQPEQIVASIVSLFSAIVDLPLNLIAIALLTRIWSAQVATQARMNQ